MKLCSKCKIEKDESEFYKDKKFKDGLTCWCMGCISENGKIRYKKNNGQVKKKYYEEHIEEIKIKSKSRLIKLQDFNMPSVLGLDISSATVGFGLIGLTDKPILLAHGHFKPLDSKYPEIERLNDIYDKITNLCEELSPTYISSEDIFIFVKGHSTARTITLLTAFNRVVSLAGYRKTNDLSFFTVNEIRKIIKNAYKIEKKLEKEDVPDIIRLWLNINFKNIMNKDKIVKETMDEADGIAAGWCKALLLINPELNKLIEKGKK